MGGQTLVALGAVKPVFPQSVVRITAKRVVQVKNLTNQASGTQQSCAPS